MKNALFILSGFCLALMWVVACGGPTQGLPDARAQDGGVGPTESRIMWLSRTYSCAERSIHAEFGLEGFEWVEMAAESVRAVHIVRVPPAQWGPRVSMPSVTFHDGFIEFTENCLGDPAEDKIIITLGLELPTE